MIAKAGSDGPSGYLAQVMWLTWQSVARLVRTPLHSRRAEAARRLSRRFLLLTALVAVLIVGLMFLLDAPAIRFMPPRGTASLWPVRILTGFGKSTNVLCFLAVMLLVIVAALPRLRGRSRAILIGFATRLQYVFFAVAFSVFVGEIIKGMVGRGRPFVGGEANPFNYSHFAWTEIYESFPSGHATTSFALAFAVSAVWPRARLAMFLYATAIILSRVVLLAHHPSDVVAGALAGVIGAMVVRQWFAARRLGFTIRHDGSIVALDGPSATDLKKVAWDALAPYEASSADRARG